MSNSQVVPDYFVAPKLNEKKLKQYKKKSLVLKRNILNGTNGATHADLKLHNDELDDESFNYKDLRYPIHSIPKPIFDQIPKNQLMHLPHKSLNPIIRNKYTTSVDSRNYFTTFEYKINDQSIIWDYNTGYVHLTGIWKALGNSKADILNLLDNAPELEPYLKRVRGGFLKIQGSWLNYDNCYKLACKICWDIRYCLVPIFGIKFLDDVLTPSDFGYGELKLNSYMPGDPNDKTSENKKKRKKVTQKVKGENGSPSISSHEASFEEPFPKLKKLKASTGASGAKRGRKPKDLVSLPSSMPFPRAGSVIGNTGSTTSTIITTTAANSSNTLTVFSTSPSCSSSTPSSATSFNFPLSTFTPSSAASTRHHLPALAAAAACTSSVNRLPALHGRPQEREIPFDEYSQMILASDSLRKLKYAKGIHRTPYKASRSSSLPNESAIMSDHESESGGEDEIYNRSANIAAAAAANKSVPYYAAAPVAPTPVYNNNYSSNYDYAADNRTVLTPSPPMANSGNYINSKPVLPSLKHSSVENLLIAADKLNGTNATGAVTSAFRSTAAGYSGSSLGKYSLNNSASGSPPASAPASISAPSSSYSNRTSIQAICDTQYQPVASSASAPVYYPASSYPTGSTTVKNSNGSTDVVAAKPVVTATSTTTSKMDIKGLIS